jgi:hypothetical protein
MEVKKLLAIRHLQIPDGLFHHLTPKLINKYGVKLFPYSSKWVHSLISFREFFLKIRIEFKKTPPFYRILA